jgi:hypothetical protein
MPRPQIPTAIVLATLLAVAGTLTAFAKEGAIATLDAPIPGDAEPGSEITVGWTVETPGGNGEVTPFNAEGMFIRLIPATGDPVEAVGTQGPIGHYVATMTVPAGGIRGVEAGLRGESCTGGTCQRSDLLFTIDESTTPAVAAENAAGANTAPEAPVDTTPPVSIASDPLPMGLVVLGLAALAIALGLVVLRVRGRSLTTGSSRS